MIKALLGRLRLRAVWWRGWAYDIGCGMTVISMVPSWMETLLQAGVTVVGRTRYCIHPLGRVDSIPVIGGTKDLDWQKVLELKPDCLTLDEEENPRWMAEESPIRWWASRIQGARDVPGALKDQTRTALLFSTEPYTFTREREELIKLGYACGLIDGESYSWFGTRARRFLAQHLLSPND